MKQRVVVVTGGAQGIGLGISMAFAKQGDIVTIVDLDEQAGKEAIARIQSAGGKAHYIPADVSDESAVKKLISSVAERHQGLHVLVNNAGTSSNAPIEEMSVAEWDRVIGVNLRAPFLMAKYATPYLKRANPGHIINIASTRALMSEPNTFPYSASKGGIVALTHSLAVSLGPQIRVNAISPGWIEVGDWKKQADKVVPHHRDVDLAQHPAGRVGTPHDIADACVFLTSEKASFITGQNLIIDGGMTVKMIYEPD